MSSKDPKGESDPVYGQSRPPPEPANGPSKETAQGGPDSHNDPVYSQHTATDSNTKGVSDPVYGQPQPTPEPSRQPPKNTTQGGPDSQNDPVYSQNASTDSHAKATSRLSQLSSQIDPSQSEPPSSNSKKARRKRTPADPAATLPADYSDILGHAATMHRISWTPDTASRGYQRQLTSGKQWARARIKQLLDPDTWRELGALTGSAKWRRDPEHPQREHIDSFVPTNNPQGFGEVTCPVTGIRKTIYLTADDFSIRGGHADGGNTLKTMQGEKLALRLKTPVVKLCDGSSGGGSVTTIAQLGYSYLPDNKILWPAAKQMNDGIPNIGCVVGPAIGLGAARVVCSHWSVMAADVGSLFNAGPKVVEGATFEEDLSFQELGGPDVHCRNGTIDNLAKDEADVFRQVRTVLGFLPDCGNLEAPPCVAPEDDVEREDVGLREVVPRRKGRGYNPWRIIESVVDRGSWFEIGALWGRTAIVGLARMAGKPVGIISLNCEVNSGALDHSGSQKMMKHLKFCDVFNLPILQFVDCPGYAIGTTAERAATMKWGVELAKAYYSTTTPIFSVVTRRSYGVAGGVMTDSRDPIFRVAWPSANWGSLPLDGGIEVGHRFELKQIREKEGEEGYKRRYQELEDEYVRLMNPVRAINAFNVEEIIDPKDTRKIVCRWVVDMYGKVMQERLRDRATRKIVPVFS
ncbi:uncharacterized protein HMPREF1541_11112 [Cyphellophora europaea CBS 101466]|uniref:CoA carboxyltransferase C-terminal domain-containing protein n=1 Tax=Cyphellophora europaea (strain CBS 101466) TaxID=1220924 RepID=W2S6W5_CYPE1|nr:uncharacterized protein HMPREF1541_11112 [Cyphellophora europaea CBS 101466]ETN43788.1 hypothetical protein HMPREF1541_11112 [Cyphellophora europaea CBS 101466]